MKSFVDFAVVRDFLHVHDEIKPDLKQIMEHVNEYNFTILNLKDPLKRGESTIKSVLLNQNGSIIFEEMVVDKPHW